MSCCVNKNYYSPQKKWILLLNAAEIRRKTHLRQPYCNLYHYAGNNPVRYIDPDGRIVRSANTSIMMTDSSKNLGNSNEKICNVGCVLTAYTRIAAAILGSNISVDDANKYAKENKLFSNGNLLTIEAGVSLINGLLEENGITDTKVEFAGSFTSSNQDSLISVISMTENFKDEYFIIWKN